MPLRSYLHPNSLNNKRSKLKCWLLLTWLNNIIAFELQRKKKLLDEECVNGINIHDSKSKTKCNHMRLMKFFWEPGTTWV
jgi:hypothetical protein